MSLTYDEWTIVTVTYNSVEPIRRYWGSRLPDGLRWIVVDNNSDDDSVEVARSLGAEVVRLPHNTGFAVANNVGLGMARTRYVLFANPDLLVIPEDLPTLASVIDEHGCLVAPRLLGADGAEQPNARGLPYFADTMANRGIPLPGARLSEYIPEISGEEPVDVDWVTGAAVAGRTDMVFGLGGWDHGYFLYFEDCELSLKAWRAGRRVMLVPEVTWVHGWAASSKRDVRAIARHLRSAATFYRRRPMLALPLRDPAGRRYGHRSRSARIARRSAPTRTVAHVFQQPVFGGPQNQLLRTAGQLEKRGWSSVAISVEGSGTARLRDGGATVRGVGIHSFRKSLDPRVQYATFRNLVADVRRLSDEMTDADADVVQVHGLINVHGVLAARRAGLPVVWQVLDTRTPRAVRYALMPLAVALADRVMFTGRSVQQAHPFSALLRRRARTYVPPVDCETFTPTGRVPEHGRLVVGTLGNINRQKGHEYLLRAVRLLVDRGHDVECRIYGAVTPTHADYHAELNRLIDDLVLADRATISDPGDDCAGALQSLDVFCLTSVPLSEGIPTAMLEGMAVGLPVVATDVGSVREVLRDATGAVVVAPGDVAAIADAVAMTAWDPRERRRAGAANRELVESIAAADVVAAVHAGIYDELVPDRPAAPDVPSRDERHPARAWLAEPVPDGATIASHDTVHGGTR